MKFRFPTGISAAVVLCAMIGLWAATGCSGPGPAVNDEVKTAVRNGPSREPAPAAEPSEPPAAGSLFEAKTPAEPPREDAPAAADAPASGSPDKAHGGGDAMRQEPLFVDWPEPDFVLFVTGQQRGYIEPCGCTGLANQKGGLVRRHTLTRELADRGWHVVPVDVGNQVRRFGQQAEIKFQMTIAGLKKMGYRAIGFGPEDLRLSVGGLAALTVGDDADGSPFVCANTAVIDASLTPRLQIVEAAGRKIGITAVLGATEQAKITSDEIVKQSPDEALRAVWPLLEEAKCDLYVLLAHASIDESVRLAQQFPHFDVVATAGGADEPAFKAEPIENTNSILVQVGGKGMFVGVIGFFSDQEPRLRYQRVPLDARFKDSPEMLQLLASYQEQLKILGLEGLGVRAIPHPSGGTFVGSQACADCHQREFDIWENTPHSWALDSLVHPGERSEIPRHFDPECISCHVVGWNPQMYFPYTSGYLSLAGTPLMHNVGCENCHGPGAAHVDAETLHANNEELLKKFRLQVRLPLNEAEKKCMECHDLDNSPDFHVHGAFERYWEEVEH
jgi:hypothetical protein